MKSYTTEKFAKNLNSVDGICDICEKKFNKIFYCVQRDDDESKEDYEYDVDDGYTIECCTQRGVTMYILSK